MIPAAVCGFLKSSLLLILKYVRLTSIHLWVVNFFGCSECAEHFGKMWEDKIEPGAKAQDHFQVVQVSTAAATAAATCHSASGALTSA